MMSIELDETDRQIVDRLFADVRVSNRQIARELGVTERTIRVRMKRLIDSGAIRFTALVNLSRAGRRLAFLWIDTVNRKDVRAVLGALELIESLSYISTLFGRADILVLTMFKDRDELDCLIHEQIYRINGVARVTRSVCEEFIKHDHHLLASFTSSSPVPAAEGAVSGGGVITGLAPVKTDTDTSLN